MGRLRATKHDLAEPVRGAMIDILNARLADTIDLALATRQARWNIKGLAFAGLHAALGGFRPALDEYVDLLAGRAVQLGGVALGTLQMVESETSLEPYPADIQTIKAHLTALIERYGQVANAIRANIDDAAEAGDAGTADLLTGISRGLDECLWMLEAHITA